MHQPHRRPAFVPPPTRGAAARPASATRAWRWLLVLSLALALDGGRLAAEPAVPEYKVKALFLYKFVYFVEWPNEAFTGPDDPVRIAILGENPFGNELAAVVRGETVRQRRIEIRLARQVQEVTDCQVVFVASSERTEVTRILHVLAARPILTVSDLPDFARRGGVTNLFLDGQKVRFEFNRDAARRAHLKIASQLLSLGRLVGATADGGDVGQ